MTKGDPTSCGIPSPLRLSVTIGTDGFLIGGAILIQLSKLLQGRFEGLAPKFSKGRRLQAVVGAMRSVRCVIFGMSILSHVDCSASGFPP